MFVSPAQAPYEGVYQRQPTGLPKAEYVPQYPEVPSAPPAEFNQPNPYAPMPNGYQPAMQYPPQPAYQNNVYGGSMYVPQTNNQQPVCFSSIQFFCWIESIILVFSNATIVRTISTGCSAEETRLTKEKNEALSFCISNCFFSLPLFLLLGIYFNVLFCLD